MIAWPTGVNQTILAETTGTIPTRVIRDTMRSGKEKKRLSSSSIPDTFPVVMRFTLSEWEIFKAWFKFSLRGGLLNFAFPAIAGTGTGEYEILSDLAWSQLGANTVKVTMTWRSIE